MRRGAAGASWRSWVSAASMGRRGQVFLCRCTETTVINHLLIPRTRLGGAGRQRGHVALYSPELMHMVRRRWTAQHAVRSYSRAVNRDDDALQIPLRRPPTHPLYCSIHLYHCPSRVPNKLDPFKSALTTGWAAFFVSNQRPRRSLSLCVVSQFHVH